MMRVAVVGMLVGCVIAGIACSGTGGTSSCEFSIGPPLPESFYVDNCREWTGASDQVAARREECAAFETVDAGIPIQTRFSNEPCPRANIVGGCRSTVAGVTYIDWYYSTTYVYDVMKLCPYAGSTFVPPP